MSSSLPNGLLPSGFPHKTYSLCTSLLSHTYHMCHPSQPPNLITLIISVEQCKSWSSSLCNFLQSPVSFSRLGPNISHSTILSNTLSPCCSLNVTDQVSHPNKTNKQNYSSVHFNLYILRQPMGRQKTMGQTVAGTLWIQSGLSFFTHTILVSLCCSKIS
jgi:hypothetical protein